VIMFDFIADFGPGVLLILGGVALIVLAVSGLTW
jgi:hypothetical protein